jgi:uncharacterized protein YyaL (SSP411 family)
MERTDGGRLCRSSHCPFPSGGNSESAERYRRIAEENATFLLRYLQTDSGRLFHTWKAAEGIVGQDGEGIAKVDGFLEDYANLADGLLALYQLTFDPRWYQAAYDLIESALARFWVSDEGFYDTATDTEKLVIRPRDLQDNATPSGNAMAVTNLLKLAGFTNDLRYVDIAHQTLAQMQTPTGGGMMSQYPLGFGQWLQGLSYALSQPQEIAIVGDPDSTHTQALLHVVRDGYRPFQVVALGAPDPEGAQVPLLQNRGLVDGQAAAYICRSFACQAPITTPQALEQLLGVCANAQVSYSRDVCLTIPEAATALLSGGFIPARTSSWPVG